MAYCVLIGAHYIDTTGKTRTKKTIVNVSIF